MFVVNKLTSLVQTLFADWGIVIDQTTKNYVLNVNRFDGAKMPPVSSMPSSHKQSRAHFFQMFLMYNPPNMMPTQILTGTNVRVSAIFSCFGFS